MILLFIFGIVALIVALWAMSGIYPFGIKKPSNLDGTKFETTSKDKYLISFKISYPLSDGTYRETKIIDAVVLADSPTLAKDLVKKKALSKIQITVVNIETKN